MHKLNLLEMWSESEALSHRSWPWIPSTRNRNGRTQGLWTHKFCCFSWEKNCDCLVCSSARAAVQFRWILTKWCTLLAMSGGIIIATCINWTWLLQKKVIGEGRSDYRTDWLVKNVMAPEGEAGGLEAENLAQDVIPMATVMGRAVDIRSKLRWQIAFFVGTNSRLKIPRFEVSGARRHLGKRWKAWGIFTNRLPAWYARCVPAKILTAKTDGLKHSVHLLAFVRVFAWRPWFGSESQVAAEMKIGNGGGKASSDRNCRSVYWGINLYRWRMRNAFVCWSFCCGWNDVANLCCSSFWLWDWIVTGLFGVFCSAIWYL